MKKNEIPVQRLLIPEKVVKAGKLLERISPFLATRFAARLFLTPFKYKRPKREHKMFENSEKQLLYISKIKRKVQVYRYGPKTAGKKALLVHGWSGTGTQLSKIADALIDKGYSITSFDAPAHGNSPGTISMMPFFIETIHQLQKEFGEFSVAVGHSLGGMSLLKACAEGLKLKKLVIIGTADSITEITNNFAKNMQLKHHTGVRMKKYFDKKFGQDLNFYSGAVSAQKVLTPTLIIHDKNDVDVFVKDAASIHSALKSGELFITENLGHRKILGDTAVINKIVNFITVKQALPADSA